jgi:hypothetical protein
MAPNLDTIDMLVSRVDRSYQLAEKGLPTDGPGCNVRLTLKKDPPPKLKKRGKKVETPVIEDPIKTFAGLFSKKFDPQIVHNLPEFDRASRYEVGDWFNHPTLKICYVEKLHIGSSKFDVLTVSGRRTLQLVPGCARPSTDSHPYVDYNN